MKNHEGITRIKRIRNGTNIEFENETEATKLKEVRVEYTDVGRNLEVKMKHPRKKRIIMFHMYQCQSEKKPPKTRYLNS